jgi:hypothetical protein
MDLLPGNIRAVVCMQPADRDGAGRFTFGFFPFGVVA